MSDWSRVTASVDQTLAALKDMEYDIMRFQDATGIIVHSLIEAGIDKVQAANIIHGIALAAIFPDNG